MSVVALIPAYNEEETVGTVIDETMGYVDQVIVCDDGSKDDTYVIGDVSGVDIIQHSRNLGYGASLSSLFNRAMELGYDIAVTIDADGQHNSEYIPQLVEPIQSDLADLVIGSRFLQGGSQAPWVKEIGVNIINKLIHIGSGLHISDSQSGYRAYRLDTMAGLMIKENGMGVSTELLLKAKRLGLRVVEVPVQVSHYDRVNPLRLLLHGFSVLFSTLRYL